MNKQISAILVIISITFSIRCANAQPICVPTASIEDADSTQRRDSQTNYHSQPVIIRDLDHMYADSNFYYILDQSEGMAGYLRPFENSQEDISLSFRDIVRRTFFELDVLAHQNGNSAEVRAIRGTADIPRLYELPTVDSALGCRDDECSEFDGNFANVRVFLEDLYHEDYGISPKPADLVVLVTDLQDDSTLGAGHLAESALRPLLEDPNILDQAILVAPFRSRFNGHIYDLPRGRSVTDFEGIQPFFVIAIGPFNLVRALQQNLFLEFGEHLLADQDNNSSRQILEPMIFSSRIDSSQLSLYSAINSESLKVETPEIDERCLSVGLAAVRAHDECDPAYLIVPDTYQEVQYISQITIDGRCLRNQPRGISDDMMEFKPFNIANLEEVSHTTSATNVCWRLTGEQFVCFSPTPIRILVETDSDDIVSEGDDVWHFTEYLPSLREQLTILQDRSSLPDFGSPCECFDWGLLSSSASRDSPITVDLEVSADAELGDQLTDEHEHQPNLAARLALDIERLGPGRQWYIFRRSFELAAYYRRSSNPLIHEPEWTLPVDETDRRIQRVQEGEVSYVGTGGLDNFFDSLFQTHFNARHGPITGSLVFILYISDGPIL